MFDHAVIEATIARLAELAAGRPALELAIGTGRVALPLAAAHLVPGGAFVVETGVPQLRRLPPGQTTLVFDRTPEHVGIDEYAPVRQGLVSHHWTPDAGWTQTPFRYVWPAELDLMARLAGMTLHERHADWTGSPFTADSESHVSVWVSRRDRG